MLSRRSFMVLTCGATLFGLSSLGYAGELKFEHHMNIGSTGRGPAQFKYVEDFAFTKSGHLLATDAANANIQVLQSLFGKYPVEYIAEGHPIIARQAVNIRGING